MGKVFPRQKQALALPIALLFSRRDWGAKSLALLRHLLLLLLDRLTFPSTCHLWNLSSEVKFCSLEITCVCAKGRVKQRSTGVHSSKNDVADLRGSPRPGG